MSLRQDPGHFERIETVSQRLDPAIQPWDQSFNLSLLDVL